MRYTYKEARKEMETYVEKMKLRFPKDAYKIQCAWESMLEGDECLAIEDAYKEGFEDGKGGGYNHGYDAGYEDAKAEYGCWSDE